MDRYEILGSHIRDIEEDRLLTQTGSPEDTERIVAALNFMDGFQCGGAVKFHDGFHRRAEWATYAAAAMTGMLANPSEHGTWEQLNSWATKNADAMLAEADGRFEHETA